MNFFTCLALSSLILQGVYAPPPPVAQSHIPNQYIVQFKSSGTVLDDARVHMAWIRGFLVPRPEQAADVVPMILAEYQIDDQFVGYSIRAPHGIIQLIRDRAEVERVEEDAIATANLEQFPAASWGLTRVSAQNLPVYPGTYYYPSTPGAGATVYVLDTGILATHPEFGGRVNLAASRSFLSSEPSTEDYNGHGTHCAGTIGSATYGVAKDVTLVAIKVLGADGSGSASALLSAIDYVANNAVPGSSVASLSLGFSSVVRSINDAVTTAVNKNIPFAIAAGNSGADACRFSPASTPNAFTVAASTITDQMAPYSNFGTCVDIFAPGSSITSTWLGNGSNTISGTSMATPHVAGVMALIISRNSFSYASAQELYSVINKLSSVNKIVGLRGKRAETPNRLLYNAGVSGTLPLP